MILVEFTINGTMHRISDSYAYLTNLWDAKIVRFIPVNYTTRSLSGGFVEPQYGEIELSPELFASYPPPVSCAITVKTTDTTEELAVTIFSGTAHLNQFDRESVSYTIHGLEYTQTFSEKLLFTGILHSVFQEIVETHLGLTFISNYVRFTPASYLHRWVEEGETVIEVLSEMAESASHLFYVSGDNAYFVDMLKNNGDDLILDEYGLFPVVYARGQVWKQYKTSSVLPYTLASSYGYGEVETSNMARNKEMLFVRIGSSSGDDHQLMAHTSVMAYDPTKYYMMEVRARKLNESDVATTAFGLIGLAEDQTTVVDTSGGTDLQAQAWIACSTQIPTTWTIYRGYAHGQAYPPPTFPCPTIGGAGGLYSDVKYFRPALAVNIGTTATTDIDYVRICEVDSSGNVLEELFFDDFSATNLPSWVNLGQAPFGPPWGNRNRYPSFVTSAADMATALANRKSILESPRATIRVPAEVGYLVNPGTKIIWTDASVGPEAITAWIRVRNISFDMDNNHIIYEGEGGIS